MNAIFSIFSKKQSTINYYMDWNSTSSNSSSTGTNLENRSHNNMNNYKGNKLYSALNKLMELILHLPKTMIMELVKYGKLSLLGNSMPISSGKCLALWANELNIINNDLYRRLHILDITINLYITLFKVAL